MSEILLYHGSKEEVVYPEIRITRYTKDFSWGFYCTNSYQKAYRWADRRSADGIVNVYRYVENPDLKILRFPEMSDEWLDFIAKCRAGETHPYDIVEGPIPIRSFPWRILHICARRVSPAARRPGNMTAAFKMISLWTMA